MAFEDQVASSVFSHNSEKSFIDKLLAKEDVNAIREIIRKPYLTRSDILEVLYLLSGTESKLVNYSEWDRYVILKFFVWIREFIKVAEILFDYKDDMAVKENTCKICHKFKTPGKGEEKCDCAKFVPSFSPTANFRKLILNNERYIQHNTKFLIDLYLNIARTSLSVGATGLLEMLKNKFEFTYPSATPITGPQQTGFPIFR